MKTNLLQIIWDKAICTFVGHNFISFGRYTHDDDYTVPRGYIRLYYICSRCSRVYNKDVVDLEIKTQ